MKFKSVTGKHEFDKNVLTKDFPDYMVEPISIWIYSQLEDQGCLYYPEYGSTRLTSPFKSRIQIHFRRKFPDKWISFATLINTNSDLMADILGLCLQNFTRQQEAIILEDILSVSGSGWKVVKTDKSANEHAKGVYDLQERVPTAVAKAAEQALSTNDTLLKAWQYCYAKDHDYDKVAVECQNALEKLLRDKYEPNQQRPQLGKQIGHIKSNVKKLTFKGDTVPTNKLILLDLIDKLPEFRGMHTAGNGTSPTKQEAEYILHTTIYIWGLHQN